VLLLHRVQMVHSYGLACLAGGRQGDSSKRQDGSPAGDDAAGPGGSPPTDDAWLKPTGQTRVVALRVVAIDRRGAPPHCVELGREREPVGPTHHRRHADRLRPDRRLRGREPDPGPDGARALAMVARACAGPRWRSWAASDPADWPRSGSCSSCSIRPHLQRPLQVRQPRWIITSLTNRAWRPGRAAVEGMPPSWSGLTVDLTRVG
jgi:hypothetical protein